MDVISFPLYLAVGKFQYTAILFSHQHKKQKKVLNVSLITLWLLYSSRKCVTIFFLEKYGENSYIFQFQIPIFLWGRSKGMWQKKTDAYWKIFLGLFDAATIILQPKLFQLILWEKITFLRKNGTLEFSFGGFQSVEVMVSYWFSIKTFLCEWPKKHLLDLFYKQK